MIKLKRGKKQSLILGFLALVLLLSMGIFSTIGSADVRVLDVFKISLSKVPFLGKWIDLSGISDSHISIIWNIRLPRIILGVIVGAGLTIAGTSFQGMFKNPMADPYIIGISSGAALGATIAIISQLPDKFLGLSTISIFAFFAALLTVFLVYNIARVGIILPVTNLLLAGVAVGQFFTAIMSFLMIIYNKDMTKIIYWTLGSLSGKGWEPVLRIGPIVIVAILLISYFSRDLNLFLTGEETAQSLGVDVEKVKIILLILCSLVTSLIVSISGIIGFVGLIIPHVSRIILGPDHRILLPASALLGGIFMIFADTIARTVISPVQIPVGIITALFGGPFFIYLLKTRN